MKKEKNCRHCGETMPKDAKTCLKCGRDQKGFFKKHEVLMIFIVFLILICIAVGIIFSKINYINNNRGSGAYTESELDSVWQEFWGEFEDVCITTDELVKEYEDNQAKADEDYIDYCIELTGEIKNIEKIDDRTLKVNLKENSDYNISLYFEKDDNEKFEELENYPSGKEITAVGFLDRKDNDLKLEYCILGDWEVYYSFDNTFNIDLDLEDLLNEAKEKDDSIELNEDEVMSFDSDILDYGYTYEDVIDSMSKISKDEIDISYISEKDTTTNKVVKLKVNDNEISVKLSKDTVVFDENLVYIINQELEKNNSSKRFYYSYYSYMDYEDIDYDEEFGIVNIAYSTEEDINKINKLLKNSNLEIDQFKKEQDVKSV